MNRYFERAKELEQELVADRRHIHENPELGLNTEKTAAYVEERLLKLGYTPKRVGKNGVSATVGKPGGKVFLLRADMDALPFQEESGLPFVSKNPQAAHCCGHDFHTAMLLTAARLLKENEGALEGTVKLMFQPGEECLLGAREMIEGGILENPKVDAAMAVHINALYPCQKFLIFKGLMTAASNGFEIRVNGHASHGARPNESIDPINVACHIHLALQEIHARELVATDVAVLTIGAILAGSANNAIPDSALLKGTLRTFDKAVRDQMMERIKTISEKVAEAFRATAEVVFAEAYTVPMSCDLQVAGSVKASADALFGEKASVLVNRMGTASEDFAFISEQVPSSFVVLGAAVSAEPAFGQHHPKVLYDEACLPVGAALEAYAAQQWLAQNASQLARG